MEMGIEMEMGIGHVVMVLDIEVLDMVVVKMSATNSYVLRWGIR